jgi:hypothetical protein
MVSRSPFRIAAICFVLALVLRLGILFGTGTYRFHDHTEMKSVALAFAATGQIANAYRTLPTGPTAHVAPLYPILMGTVYRVFGDGETGETVKEVLASCVSSARAPLLVLLALALGLGEGTALAAGLLSAIFIGAFETELKGDWEGPFAANVFILLVFWGYRLTRDHVSGPLASLAYGIAWGLALLISPSLLPPALGLTALVIYTSKARIRIAPAVACFAVGCVLALSPWIVRNYLTLGGFVWGRDNFGLELSLSNGPGAHWSNPQNQKRIFSMHPNRYRPAAEKVLAQGELAFNEDRKREAIQWIGDHPREFAAMSLQRAIHFWFPGGRNRAHGALLGALTLLAFAGLIILGRRHNPAFAITAVIWLLYPLLYYAIQWSSRYRQPIDWTLILCASVTVYQGYLWIRPKPAT